MFRTNSFVELLPMENVEHKVSIEIDFKANSLQGKQTTNIHNPVILSSLYFKKLAMIFFWKASAEFSSATRDLHHALSVAQMLNLNFDYFVTKSFAKIIICPFIMTKLEHAFL